MCATPFGWGGAHLSHVPSDGACATARRLHLLQHGNRPTCEIITIIPSIGWSCKNLVPKGGPVLSCFALKKLPFFNGERDLCTTHTIWVDKKTRVIAKSFLGVVVGQEETRHRGRLWLRLQCMAAGCRLHLLQYGNRPTCRMPRQMACTTARRDTFVATWQQAHL